MVIANTSTAGRKVREQSHDFGHSLGQEIERGCRVRLCRRDRAGRNLATSPPYCIEPGGYRTAGLFHAPVLTTRNGRRPCRRKSA